MRRCSKDRALHAVQALCDLGPREGGTPSGHASAAWIARRLRGLGLKPEVREDPEHWVYESRVVQLTATADQGAPGEESLSLSRTTPFRFSPSSSGAASLSTGLPSTGAYLGGRVPRKTETGALSPSLILVDPGDSWPRARSLREGGTNQSPTLAIAQSEGQWLRRCLAEERSVRIQWELEASAYRARSRTVLAALPARRDAPPGFFLIMAHADSDGGGQGVNSNASGVAVLLEIARAWSAAVREGATPPPAREVRFAVWGSQAHSPRAWLSSHLRKGDAPLLGVLDLRRLALSSAGHRLCMEPDDHSPNDELIRHAVRRLGAAKGASGIPERWVTNRSRGGSGVSAFLHAPALRGAGVPAISLFAAGSWKSEEVQRTLGKTGESWSDRDLITIPHDPLVMSRGDAGADRIKDGGALMEAAARSVLIILPSWLEGLPG